MSAAGNGLTESRSFSQYGKLDAWTVSVGGNTVASYALTRDAAGNIASRTRPCRGESRGGADESGGAVWSRAHRQPSEIP